MAVMTSSAFDKVPFETKAMPLMATDATALAAEANGLSHHDEDLFEEPASKLLESNLTSNATDLKPQPTMNGNHTTDGAESPSDLATAPPVTEVSSGIAPVADFLPEHQPESNSLFDGSETGTATTIPPVVEAPSSDLRHDTESIPNAPESGSTNAAHPAPNAPESGSTNAAHPAESAEAEPKLATKEAATGSSDAMDISQDLSNAPASFSSAMDTTEDAAVPSSSELPDRSANETADASATQPTPLSIDIQQQTSQMSLKQSPTDADQGMDEAPSSGKVRSREEDDDDIPEAKRTKTDETVEGQGEFKVPDAPAQNSQILENGTVATAEQQSIQSAVASDDWPTSPMTKAQNKFLLERVRNTKKIKVAISFKEPVNPVALNIPQYFDFVKNPMDLSTMENKLKEEQYPSVLDFMKDLDQIVDNSVTFNGKQHPVTQAAYNMRAYFLKGMSKMPKPGVEEPVQPKKPKKPMVATTTKPRRESRTSIPKVASPVAPPPSAVSPQTPWPLNSDGLPLIRRDSSTANDRPKREIHRPPPKDLPYNSVKPKKKKYQLELKFCESVMTEMLKPKYQGFSYPFLKPVDPVALNIPQYLKIIKKPMDLGTIDKNLREGQYQTAKDFHNDVMLVFNNCYKFNPETDEVHKMGKQLHDLFEKLWSEKGTWLSIHGPDTNSPASESEEEEEEEEVEDDEDVDRLTAIQRQIEALNKELSSALQSKSSKRASPKAAGKKAKAAKAPKTKKTSLVPPPKTGVAKAKPRMKPAAPLSFTQKQEISDGISTLSDSDMRRAVQIIRNGCPHLADVNDDEMEIDMDEIGDDTLRELFKFIKSTKVKAPVDDDYQETTRTAKATTASKPKKNKPMGKKEQEDKIRMIQERLQNFSGPGASGSSQSPPANDDSSDDDEDDDSGSESEEE